MAQNFLSDIKLGDNIYIRLGDATNGDLQLFHNGTNSIINDNGTGNLQFQIAGTPIFDVTSNGITMAGWPESDYELKGDIDGGVRFDAQAGEALSKGDVVYISGASGDNTVVSKAQANSASTMPAFGLVLKDAANGAACQIVTFGNLYGSGAAALDTSTCTVGDEIFVSAATAGEWTKTAPTGESNLVQKIGKILRVATSNGVIKVSGAGRANATPNLNTGRLFVGNASNQAVADGTMYVDIANSKVGIGTTSPDSLLTISDSGGAGLEVIPQTSNDRVTLLSYDRNTSTYQTLDTDSSDVHFNINGSEKMRLDSSGRLGLNVTSLSSMFTLQGNELGGQTVTHLHLNSGNNNSFPFLASLNNATISSATYGWTFNNSSSTGNLEIGRRNNSTTSSTVLTLERSTGNATFAGSIIATDSSTSTIKILPTGGTTQFISRNSADDGYVSHISDATQHIYKVSNSEKMRLDSNGRLGLGVTSPSAPLSIQTSSTSQTIRLIGRSADGSSYIQFRNNADSSNYAEIGSDNNSVLLFNTNGSEAMRLDSSGNLGLGTTNATPSNGGGMCINGGGITRIDWRNSTTGDATGDGTSLQLNGNDFTIENRESGYVAISTSLTERMRIDSSGNVGINQTNPSSKLHITNASGGSGGYLKVTDAVYNGDVRFGMADGIDNDAHFGTWTNNNIVAFTNGSERARFDSSGRLGLGTSSPSSYDSNADDLVIASTGNTGITIAGGTTGASSIYFADGTSGGAEYTGFIDYLHSSDALRFGTNGGTERLRITSDGNVGIGTTSPSFKLDINAGSNAGVFLTGSSDARYHVFSTSSSNWVGYELRSSNSNTFAGGIFRNNADNDRVSLYNKTTEAISLKDGGNVGIGTASPTSRLRVKSTGSTEEQITIESSGNTNTLVAIGQSDNGNSSGAIELNNTNGAIGTHLDGHGASYFNNGNVGIGTTSPDTLLELSKAVGTGTSLVKLTNSSSPATSNIAQIDFELSNSFSGSNVDVQIGAIKTNAGNEESAFFIKTTSGTGTPTERMRLDSNGVLQLTETSASGFLNANGTSLELDVNRHPETGAFGDANKSHARISLTGSDGGSIIAFNTSSANNTVATERMRIASDGTIKFNSYGAGYLKTDANGVISVDTDTIEDTLQSVTDRGASTDNAITISTSTNRTLTLDYTGGGTGSYSIMSFKQSGTEQFRLWGNYTDNYLSFYNDQASVHQLKLNSDGSTTFAGTLTVEGAGNSAISGDLYVAASKKYISTSSSSGDYVRLYAAGGTGEWDIYGNGNNLRFSENSGVSGAKVVVDTDLQVDGDLIVTGTSTSVNVEDLNVEQGEITLNYAASSDTSSSANGAGIRIQDAVDASNDATILWDQPNLEFDFSHGASFAGQVETKNNAGIYSFSDTVNASSSEDIFTLSNSHGAQAFRVTFVCNTSGFSVAKTFEVVHQFAGTPVFAKVVDTGAYSSNDFSVAFANDNDQGMKCTITNASTTINADIVTTVFLGGSPTDITVTEL